MMLLRRIPHARHSLTRTTRHTTSIAFGRFYLSHTRTMSTDAAAAGQNAVIIMDPFCLKQVRHASAERTHTHSEGCMR